MGGSSRRATSSPAFGVVGVLNFRHSSQSVVVSDCRARSQFPRPMMRSIFSPGLFVIFFGRGVSSDLWPIFLTGSFAFSLLSFKSSLCIPVTKSLSDRRLAHIFSLSFSPFECFVLFIVMKWNMGAARTGTSQSFSSVFILFSPSLFVSDAMPSGLQQYFLVPSDRARNGFLSSRHILGPELAPLSCPWGRPRGFPGLFLGGNSQAL